MTQLLALFSLARWRFSGTLFDTRLMVYSALSKQWQTFIIVYVVGVIADEIRQGRRPLLFAPASATTNDDWNERAIEKRTALANRTEREAKRKTTHFAVHFLLLSVVWIIRSMCTCRFRFIRFIFLSAHGCGASLSFSPRTGVCSLFFRTICTSRWCVSSPRVSLESVADCASRF